MTKNPKPAAKTIDTAMISSPEAIPPSLNAILFVILDYFKSFLFLTISDNYSNLSEFIIYGE